ncbi:transposable element Tcb2 transposase [Trichonephila clavipes]|nr:transposable element Tcb2 transposase [Trichonephila clavipes]
MGLQFLFMDDNAPCHRTVAAEQLLESKGIERMDWPARSPDLNPIEHVWEFLNRRLADRTLPQVTIRELRLALQDEWAAMPQQLIDTLILSMGIRCETCLAVRGRSYPLLKTGFFLLDTHHRDVSAFSRIALHATFSIKLLFIPLFSLLPDEYIVVDTEELHLENCLKDMKENNDCIPLKKIGPEVVDPENAPSITALKEVDAIKIRYGAIEGRRRHRRDDGLKETESKDAICMD